PGRADRNSSFIGRGRGLAASCDPAGVLHGAASFTSMFRHGSCRDAFESSAVRGCVAFADVIEPGGPVVSTLVTGIFSSRVIAETAAEELMKSGFSAEDISLLMSESTRGREFAVKSSTKAPEGAVAGAR